MTNTHPVAETECRCCGEPTTEVYGPGLCGTCAEEISRDLDDQRAHEMRVGRPCCSNSDTCGGLCDRSSH